MRDLDRGNSKGTAMLSKSLMKHRGMSSLPRLTTLQRVCTCCLSGQIVVGRCQESVRPGVDVCTLLLSPPGHHWVVTPLALCRSCQLLLPW